MKAAFLYGLQDLRLVDIPIPVVTPKSVLVKVHACGICPSDIRKYYTLHGGQLKLPDNMGHEHVGTVIAVGENAEGFEVGMRIAGDGFGAYAEYALIDLTLNPSIHNPSPLVIPDSITDSAATFLEPLACCIHALKDIACVTVNQTVLIIGGGTMGQLNLMVAKSVGARVILSEPYEPRRDMALALGADMVINPQEGHLADLVRNVTSNTLVDATILTIGNPASVQDAIETVRFNGKVVLFGRFPPGAKMEVDPQHLYLNEIMIQGSHWVGSDPARTNINAFKNALDLIMSGIAPVERLISKTYPLSQIHEAFSSAMSMDTFKVILVP